MSLESILKSVMVKVLFLAFPLFSFLSLSFANAQDGKVLFQNNCASCHGINKDLTGPALMGVRDRVPDKALLTEWVKNNKKVLASGNPYFTELYNKWNKVAMNLFPSLKDEEIEAIFNYVDATAATLAKSTNAKTQDGGGASTQQDDSSDVALYLAIFIGLVLLAFVFRQINYRLEKAIAERNKQTIPALTPFFRDKRYWVIFSVVLTILFGIYLANKGINAGLQQNYQPEQPIFFSHRVHAGVNKIECIYCHSSAPKSKHSQIPTVNVCMNCHKAINEYSGNPALVTAEGDPVDGTAEIKKLYKYANFEVGKPWNAANGNNPIEWKRIHNLPDHVKFYHAQHVSVGKIECQTCHGQVQEMDEVYQYNTLSMGWCINCHRQTEVKFKDNDFYKSYLKLHQDLSTGKLKKVTVSDVGGTECQKCHY